MDLAVSPSPAPQYLAIPQTVALRVTAEQFEAIAQANPDLQLERTATGELIMAPPTGGETGYRNIKLAYFLVKWIEEEGGFGIPFDSSTGFRLPNGADRSPNAAWISPDRWATLTPTQREGFVPLCPDFVIELRSKTDSLTKIQSKMQEYYENGAKLGWLIDPQTRTVEIYRSGQPREVLQNPTALSGETILPGFSLTLDRIW